MKDRLSSQKNEAAIKIVISTAVHLSMAVVDGENLELWRDRLREALENCSEIPPVACGVFAAANVFAYARSIEVLGHARSRLHFEVHTYFQRTAGAAVDRLDRLLSNEVVV